MWPYQILLLLFCAFNTVNSYKILTYCARFGQSHIYFMGGISDVLAEAGHNVTYLQPEVVERTNKPGATRATVLVRKADFGSEMLLDQSDVWNGEFGIGDLIKQFTAFGQLLSKSCYHMLKDNELMDRLAKEKFDMGIGEHYDSCTYALFHRVGIRKFISTYAVPIYPQAFHQLGLPLTTSFIPSMSSHGTTEMSYGQRMKNFIGSHLFKYIAHWAIGSPLQTSINEALGYEFNVERVPHSSYYFVNTDEHLDYIQPITPKVIHIGGLRLGKPNPLPAEFDRIAKQSVRGIVIISFGTVALSSKMSNQTKNEFVTFISNFPDITFVWKYETPEDNYVPKLSNLIMKPWIPQSDLLAHPKTLAFVSHSGMNSISETAHRGVPVIAIPLFADQQRNALMAQYRGIARVVKRSELTAHTLTQELNKILSPDEPYRLKAKHLSQMIQAKPFTAAQRVVQLTEHAIKFNVSENLDMFSRKLSVWQYYGFDVYAPLFTVLTLVLAVLYLVLRQIARIAYWLLLGEVAKTVGKTKKLD